MSDLCPIKGTETTALASVSVPLQMDGCKCDSFLGLVLLRAERPLAGFGCLRGFESLGASGLFGLHCVSVHDWVYV